MLLMVIGQVEKTLSIIVVQTLPAAYVQSLAWKLVTEKGPEAYL